MDVLSAPQLPVSSLAQIHVLDERAGPKSERVIGSGSTLEYRAGDVYRTRGVEQPIDDGPGKPVHIWTRTGHKPLLAGGNSDAPCLRACSANVTSLIRARRSG